MLPLQITLEGFMSYRDKTTLSFEGAPLWMLAGANGAGKSSVFDAMRWTLFGAHRGGKSGHEALINRGKNRLRVAFDLELDGKRFRLLRTLARAGRATWQIEEIGGETAIKIPETDMREGYEKWVRENIGLGDETFCTAMYLAQNRGDAILSANPNQRYEMLAEIVDISAYAALHETAKTRASQLEIASRASERAWQLAPGADADEIAAWVEKLRELNAQISRQAARREQILGLEPLAAQWQDWKTGREATEADWEAARVILADGAQIERDFARWSELESVVPPLGIYAQARQRKGQNQREIAVCDAERDAARQKTTRLESEVARFASESQALETARQKSEAARLAAISQAAVLAPQLATARQIANYQAEIARLQGELRDFPADLAARKADLERNLARAEREIVARAILARFAREKTGFLRARAGLAAVEKTFETLQSALPGAQEKARQTQIALESAQHAQGRGLDAWSASNAAADAIESAIERFESVENEASCSFCGQLLTPEHAQKERARLEKERAAAQNAQEDARIALEASNQNLTQAKYAFQIAQIEVNSGENALQSGLIEQKNAKNNLDNAFLSARDAWGELDAEWQNQWETAALCSPPTVPSDRFLAFLGSDFPSSEELARAPEVSRWLETQRTQVLAQIAAQEEARRGVAARLSDRQNQLAPLLEGAPLENLETLERLESESQNALQAATGELERGEKAGKAAQQGARNAREAWEAARAQLAQLESRSAGLSAAQREIERALQSAQTGAVEPFAGLDDLALVALWEQLEAEKTALGREDWPATIADLRAAQDRARNLEGEVARLERALESVPLEARRAPGELRIEAEALKAALETDGEAQKRAVAEKNRLEERRDEKTRLESEHLQAQNAARQHKTLADLLGPHELQRFLLREAETGIIDEANATLDRISGGELRLELRADDDEIAGARKGPPKVLDVAIFRAGDGAGETGARGQGMPPQGMLPAFLSGSQRFRVAVALALGIGRFATRGGGTRLEAVIIDEGFGALDKIGRGEMIDELQILGQELRRVILVSHQEEFFEAFPNRYLIENNGETSSARLMVN